MSKVVPQKVAVLGAGPIGLEAALYAKACGLSVAVYDRGQIADHIRQWGHVRMFTPFGLNATPLGLKTLLREKPNRTLPASGDIVTGREFRDAYLVPLGESEPLLESLQQETSVLHVGRATKGFRLLVRTAAGQERIDTADIVLDCTGTFATPKWLGDADIPAVGELAARSQIATGLEEIAGERKAHYAGRSIALIGDSYSAATTICALATLAEEHPATWVFWITRGARGQPLPRVTNDPFKERDRLAVKANSLATRCDGNLEFHPQTVLDEVISHGPDKGFRIAGRSNGKPVSWEVERVIANVGYRPDTALRVDGPGYFTLGAKSRDSGFLLRDGFEQIKQTFAAITGNAQLDHYGKKAA
ncbi:MAG: monooxygenase [Planctomycetaceae bacterium]|nr:monooxygenase [Planctomycetaceae bacterium]